MMQWVPSGAPDAEFREHVRTFAAVFQSVAVMRGSSPYGYFMLGSDGPITLDPVNTRAILERPGVLEDISTAYDSPASTIDDWLAVIDGLRWLDNAAARAYAGAGPLITDDRPRPEYFLLRRWLGVGD